MTECCGVTPEAPKIPKKCSRWANRQQQDSRRWLVLAQYEAVSADSKYAVLCRMSASSNGIACVVELRVGSKVMVEIKTCPKFLERVLALLRADSAF